MSKTSSSLDSQYHTSNWDIHLSIITHDTSSKQGFGRRPFCDAKHFKATYAKKKQQLGTYGVFTYICQYGHSSCYRPIWCQVDNPTFDSFRIFRADIQWQLLFMGHIKRSYYHTTFDLNIWSEAQYSKKREKYTQGLHSKQALGLLLSHLCEILTQYSFIPCMNPLKFLM